MAERKPRPLDDRDLLLLEATVRNPEATQQQLADAIGISLRSVNHRVNNPVFKAEQERAYRLRIDKALKIAQAYTLDSIRELTRIIGAKQLDPETGQMVPRIVEDRDRINAILALDKLKTTLEKNPLKVEFPNGVPLSITPEMLSRLSDEMLEVFEQVVAALTEGKNAQ